jgi:hypothetical protein
MTLHGTLESEMTSLPPKLPRRWRFLLSIGAILGALVLIEDHGTALLRGFPQLRAAAHEAVLGPELVTERLTKNASVQDGDTSDGSKAYRKFSEACVNPTHGGTLVRGSGDFIESMRSNPRTTKEVTRDDAGAYCVKLSAATSAKERLEIISGYATALEQFPKKS